jgi:thioredoxin
MLRLIIIQIAALFHLLSCAQNSEVLQIDSREFQRLIQTYKGVLLDVRTRSEFSNGHIENSGNLNYYALDFRKKLELLPKDQAIYLYCNTGYRSEKAAEMLLDMGYTKVYNLQHGIMEWELNNFKVVVEPDARPDLDYKMEPEEFAELIASGELLFIDFYAPWCGPCLTMMPIIDSLKVEYHANVQIVKINADASKKLVKELQLIGVPYLALYYRGNLLFTKNGAMARTELTSLLDQNIEKYIPKRN